MPTSTDHAGLEAVGRALASYCTCQDTPPGVVALTCAAVA